MKACRKSGIDNYIIKVWCDYILLNFNNVITTKLCEGCHCTHADIIYLALSPRPSQHFNET